MKKYSIFALINHFNATPYKIERDLILWDDNNRSSLWIGKKC